MLFQRYDSIENSFRDKHVAKCISAISSGRCNDDDFVVEEKAHGANFSFYFDGTNDVLKTARRNSFLEKGDEEKRFYESHRVKQRYESKIRGLYTLICKEEEEEWKQQQEENQEEGGKKTTMTGGEEEDDNVATTAISSIRVIGELIGGAYNHPDVEADKTVPRILKGVEYCPGHEFYAFDISVSVVHVTCRNMKDMTDPTETKKNNTSKSSSSTVTTFMMDRLKANRLFETVGMPLYAKPLFRGTLAECLAFDNTFKSYIPSWLGLPEHPGANLAEGKVIKPVQFARIHSGGERLILKDKTEAFAEVAYGGGSAKTTSSTAAAKRNVARTKNNAIQSSTATLSEKGTELLNILLGHLTENRLTNVLSNNFIIMSEEESLIKNAKTTVGRVCGLLSKDALEDFRKDYGEEFDNDLDKKERKAIQKVFSAEVAALVRSAI